MCARSNNYWKKGGHNLKVSGKRYMGGCGKKKLKEDML